MNVAATDKGLATPAPVTAPAPRNNAADGKKLPPAGKAAPGDRSPPDATSVGKAIEQIQTFLRDSKQQLEFQVDESSGQTVIKVTDASGQLVRQMPSEEVLRIAAVLDSEGFHSFNDVA